MIHALAIEGDLYQPDHVTRRKPKTTNLNLKGIVLAEIRVLAEDVDCVCQCSPFAFHFVKNAHMSFHNRYSRSKKLDIALFKRFPSDSGSKILASLQPRRYAEIRIMSGYGMLGVLAASPRIRNRAAMGGTVESICS